MEKEAVQMKMREIIETSFSVPSLKEAILTLIEDQAKQSHFLFGRLASLHYEMFAKNMKEMEHIAAAIELIMLAGDLEGVSYARNHSLFSRTSRSHRKITI
jgi:competence protein ComQ